MRARTNPDAGDLARLADRVGERLRHLSAARLGPVEDEVRGLVEQLSQVALAAEGVAPRPIPKVSARALGDQVTVLGHDLAAALVEHPSPDLLARADLLLAEIRRVVP